MGVEYNICCHDCKVRRDLDKFYLVHLDCGNREEALASSESMAQHGAFKAVLLATFLAEHMGHNCSLISDSDDIDREQKYPFDINFWNSSQEDFDERNREILKDE